VSPKKTIKKKGPHKSQSLKALPGSSRYGFGNTTSFKLLTILDRSLFIVSQTGSVNVFGRDPNPVAAILPPAELPVLGGRGGRGAEGTADGGF
jgi:hypothetical protein